MKINRLFFTQGFVGQQIDRTNTEYAEICKTVRKLLRDDIQEYNTMRVKEAVETGKGRKKAINKEECKVMIPSLKEEDGSIITKREMHFTEMCRVL